MFKGLLYALGFCLALCLTGYWLIATPSGLQAAWRMAVPLADKFAAVQLQASSIEGRLVGPLQLRDFHYQDAALELRINQAEIDWQPRALLDQRIELATISADKIHIALQATEEKAEQSDKATGPLPISVHIQQAQINELLIRTSNDADPIVISNTQATLEAIDDRLVIKQLKTNAFDISATLQGCISWQGNFPMAVDAQLIQTLPEAGTLNSNIEAAGDLQQFGVTLSTAAPYGSQLTMQWTAVEQGYDVAINGPFEPTPLLVALGQLPTEALSTGPLTIDARGLLSSDGFKASKLHIEHQNSQLDGQANVDWQGEKLAWTAEVSWQNLALPPWAPQLHSAQGTATAQGSAQQGQVQLNADYQVQTQAVGKANIAANWNANHIELLQGELAASRSQIKAQGSLWPLAQLTWSANSPDLGELWPAASGQINGQGEFKGDWQAPQIIGELQASQLNIADFTIAKLRLNANLNLQQDKPGFLKLAINGFKPGSADAANVKLDVSGTRSAHTLAADWESAQLSAALQAKGGWTGGQAPWLGQLTRLNLKPPQTQQWRLQSPTQLKLHSQQLEVQRFCLLENQAKLCAQGSKQAAQWQGEAELKQLPLALLSTWLPDSLGLQGLANAKAAIKGVDAQWQTLTASGSTSAQLSRTDVADKLDLELKRFSLTANPQQWQAAVDGQIGDSGEVKLKANATPQGDAWQNAQLQGKLQLALPRLNELALIVPEIDQLRGQVKGSIKARGSLGKPSLTGQLKLDQGRLDLRDYGISLNPLTAKLSGKADGSLHVDLSATSDGGKLHILGKTNTDFANPSLDATIQGERFLAARTDEATVYISPDLKLKVQNQQVELTGELGIPEAQLKPGQPQAEVQTVSDDQILISNTPEVVKEPLWQIMARLRLVLGDKVSFLGMGVQTQLTGKLDIREDPNKPTTANGEIRLIDGAYEVYGQKLDIDTGRLIFANAPITQPAIDLKASREPRPKILVGVRVRGLLDAPTVKLFSTPAMRQAEQLSYLVLGRPLEGNEGDPTLASAALALGLNQGDKYIKGLSDSLNVDEIGIETTPGESAETASLVVGKYLSPRLYVSYGAGLFEPLHKLRMRYRISEHWTLTGESGTAQGADILYTIER